MGETFHFDPPWKWGKLPILTPLNPPLEMGETGKISSLPFARGGLGWGNLMTNGDSITCL